MIEQDIPYVWADRFGLAPAPLFEEDEMEIAGLHKVLLDGGYGSFALSICKEQIWKNELPSSWSWSCNLPHHVTITDQEVAIVRWDKESPEQFSRSSIEKQLDAFYDYLSSDRINSNKTIVNYMIWVFRRIRSLVFNAGISDNLSIDAFLSFLDITIERSNDPSLEGAHNSIILEKDKDILESLDKYGVEELFQDITKRHSKNTPIKCIPILAVRHAGSAIFQEAHLELFRAPAKDLFGSVGPVVTGNLPQGGANFTPAALARSITEQAINTLLTNSTRDNLIVLDPACGSGIFLHEVLRTLRRTTFHGHLTLIGRDISAPAVSMTRFVLKNAVKDWMPPGGCKLDLEQRDSLEETFPPADLILMNPPFISWSVLTKGQREQMLEVLGHRLRGRADYSMAFVTRAIESLRPNGVLGTLFPGSLLNLLSANKWREDILEKMDLRFIGSIGDYGLFSHAQVQVAAAIFSRPITGLEQPKNIKVLISGNNAEATGNALRALRYAQPIEKNLNRDDQWQVFDMNAAKFRAGQTWRLMSDRMERAINEMLVSGRAVRVKDIFTIHQGILTGLNAVFLLRENELQELPKKERKWFRPALMNEDISTGRVSQTHFLFYPYNREGLAISSEKELIQHLPTYFDRYLFPNKKRLEQRANIVRGNRRDWRGLSEKRTWTFDSSPHLISKYFGGPGSFTVNFNQKYNVVQGYAWFPNSDFVDQLEGFGRNDIDVSLEFYLSAYSSIFNSNTFCKFLSVYSSHVAGGQFNFSPRFVLEIPIPNVLQLSRNESDGSVISQLANLALSERISDWEWHSQINQLTAGLYNIGIFSPI